MDRGRGSQRGSQRDEERTARREAKPWGEVGRGGCIDAKGRLCEV